MTHSSRPEGLAPAGTPTHGASPRAQPPSRPATRHLAARDSSPMPELPMLEALLDDAMAEENHDFHGTCAASPTLGAPGAELGPLYNAPSQAPALETSLSEDMTHAAWLSFSGGGPPGAAAPAGSPTSSAQHQPASPADLLPPEPALQAGAKAQVQHSHGPQEPTSNVQCSGHGCPPGCCGCFLKKMQQLSYKTYGCQLNGLPPPARLALVSLLLS
jgi:hypothetical protein